MNKAYSLLTAALAGVALFTSPVIAKDAPLCVVCGNPCAVCSTQDAVKPYPIKVVNPTLLPRTFSKSTVTLALTLDEKGVPSDIHPVNRVDKAVAERLVAAVAQWRFSPMYVHGVPVAGPVVLPIEITPVDGA